MMPPSPTSLPCRRKILRISLWIQIGFVFAVATRKDGAVSYVSKQDVLLLKDEQHPKCFTRTGHDFTCFFETEINRTYDLLYKINSMQRENRCDVTVQRSEEGTSLHICSFPSMDVFLFVETQIDVVQHGTNISVCSRTLSVEDHFLLDPPFNVSLNQNGRVGQLLVSWHTNIPTYCGDVTYRIRCSSEGLGEKTVEVKKDKYNKAILNSLVPGKETDINVAVKCAFSPSAGHWSRWSDPVRAMVPQSADDISLTCYTSDLQNITCQWNGSRYGVEEEGEEYKLLFSMGLSEEWTECPVNGTVSRVCRFHGDDSKKVRVKLSRTRTPLSRTFYTEEFTLNNTIRTSSPAQLRGSVQKDKLCLKWDAPLLSLSAHLQYEVGYQTRGGEAWMMVSLVGPDTGTCLQVPPGSKYNVKVRAKPNGSIYSGHWSHWSDMLTGHTGHTSTDTGMLLMLCIPVSVMTVAIFLISTYLSKLKQYFWPPVPNLDKVLQDFLTEIDKERWVKYFTSCISLYDTCYRTRITITNFLKLDQWQQINYRTNSDVKDPPLTVKQWSEETTSSVVEIISEDRTSEGSKLSEEANRLLPQEGAVTCGKLTNGHIRSEVSPDYVTLNKDSLILHPKGNKHMYEKVGETVDTAVGAELLQTYQCSCTDVPPYLVTDLLNFSYVPLTEAADTLTGKVTPANESGNLYTNLPCN